MTVASARGSGRLGWLQRLPQVELHLTNAATIVPPVPPLAHGSGDWAPLEFQRIVSGFRPDLPVPPGAASFLVTSDLHSFSSRGTEQLSRDNMAARKQFQTSLSVKPELKELLDSARARPLSESDLQEQRISFAFGNAPQSDLITKDSVRFASKHIRLKR